MLRGFFDSLIDGFRHRFRPIPGHYYLTNNESLDRLARHNDAEARVIGRTISDPAAIRAFGKERPR